MRKLHAGCERDVGVFVAPSAGSFVGSVCCFWHRPRKQNLPTSHSGFDRWERSNDTRSGRRSEHDVLVADTGPTLINNLPLSSSRIPRFMEISPIEFEQFTAVTPNLLKITKNHRSRVHHVAILHEISLFLLKFSQRNRHVLVRFSCAISISRWLVKWLSLLPGNNVSRHDSEMSRRFPSVLRRKNTYLFVPPILFHVSILDRSVPPPASPSLLSVCSVHFFARSSRGQMRWSTN
jgi:hypothetical protein